MTEEPGTGADSADDGGSAGGADQHDDRGLDLARAMARVTAESRPTPGAAQRRPPGGRQAGRGPRRAGTADAAVGGVRGSGARGRGGMSGAGADERDPQSIESTLGRLVRDHGWTLDLRVHGVIGRWAELVGPEVAEHTTPESFAEGRLTVRTDSTAWATQLKLLAPTLVRRLNEELGHGTVLVIDVLGPHLPTWTKGRRSVRGARGPRDTYG